MEPILLSEIPGLDEAVRQALRDERDIRARPFLPLPAVIAGVPLLPLTLRHYVLLEAVGSPFLAHDRGQLGDVLQFLWIFSANHVCPSPWLSLREVKSTRQAFMRRIYRRAARCLLGKVCAKMRAYVGEALFECAKAQASGNDLDGPRPATHIAAAIIDEFAAVYGWPDENLDARGQPDRTHPGIFDIPVARLMQYRRAGFQREHPRRALPNPLSDGVERRFLQKHQAKAARRSRASQRSRTSESIE
jgi:hypothetical protein